MKSYHEDMSWLTIRAYISNNSKQNGNKIFYMQIFNYMLLAFCFRYPYFYHKSKHQNLLQFLYILLKR